MPAVTDSRLQLAIEGLSPPGIVIGHRLISHGDEHALMPEETHAFALRVVELRRASGAARIIARQLLEGLEYTLCALPKSPSGGPMRPQGIVGSISHDSRVAVAAVGTKRQVAALGIDIEPPDFLPPGLLEIVATPQERLRIGDDPYCGPALCCKRGRV